MADVNQQILDALNAGYGPEDILSHIKKVSSTSPAHADWLNNFHQQTAYIVTTVNEAINLVNNFPDVPVINVYVLGRRQNLIASEQFNQPFHKLNADETSQVLDLKFKYLIDLLRWIQDNKHPLVFVDLLKEDYLATIYNNRYNPRNSPCIILIPASAGFFYANRERTTCPSKGHFERKARNRRVSSSSGVCRLFKRQ